MGEKMLLLFGFFAFTFLTLPSAANRIQNHCGQQMPCDNCQCVDREEWCNGHSKCADGSDEKYCQFKYWYSPDPNNCASTHFLCSDGRCVPVSVQCDSYFDCLDESDEEHCDTETTEYDPWTTTTTKVITTTTKRPRSTPSPTPFIPSQPCPSIPETATTSSWIPERRRPARPFSSPCPNIPETSSARTRPNIPETSSARTRPNIPETSSARTRPKSPSTRPPPPLWPETTTRSTRFPLTHPSLIPSIYSSRLKFFKPFHFATDYAKIYGSYKYSSVISKAVQWLLNARDRYGDWGRDTPRILIALSLVSNSFISGIHEYDLTKKHFQVLLGLNLLRISSEPIPLSRQAVHINALLATCQNPTNFHGFNLAESLKQQVESIARNRERTVINPVVYLALCLMDQELSLDTIDILRRMIRPSEPFDEEAKDTQSLAATALACYSHQRALTQPNGNPLDADVREAISQLLQRQNSDGSFGSIYSTALAAQALISFNNSGDWNHKKTLTFLADKQQPDGSFGDLLATYFVLPVLSGRSLVHLRNTICDPPIISKDLSPEEILDYPGPKHYIRYSLHFGNPLRKALTVLMHLPVKITLFDAMRVAEYINADFKHMVSIMKTSVLFDTTGVAEYINLKFAYEEIEGNIYVYSISNVPNDSERGFSWYLYVKERGSEEKTIDQQELFTGDIREYTPNANDHIVFWYFHLRTLGNRGGIV